MSVYICDVCEYAFDEGREDKKWDDLPEDWHCPVCESGKNLYHPSEADTGGDEKGEPLLQQILSEGGC